MTEFKDNIVYQIWPRSFLDSNGDGIGDLRGVISKLDYIASLGADLIWLSPIYASSNMDYGYDIDDYYRVNPEFGTMEDFEALVAEAKKRGVGILMDLVPAHTSSAHAWFRQALADPHSPYRDYYFFRPGRQVTGCHGETTVAAPNNWMSFFGGSAWQKDEASGEYYLTMFAPDQCDLNWANPAVRQHFAEIVRFWRGKGVAGFRVDVVNSISKAEGLPDAAGGRGKLQFPQEHIISQPLSHAYLHELQEKGFEGCFTVGEGALVTPEELNNYTAPDRGELDMMFQFELAGLGCGPLGKYDFRRLYRWSIPQFKDAVERWQTSTQQGGGWLGNYLSNHDQPRQVSRFGNDGRDRVACAKALAMFNLTLRGTPFIYQGEEFGMTNCPLARAEWKDYEAQNAYRVLQSMMHLPGFLAEKIVRRWTRDNARTPVQWTSGEHAGFSSAEPWLKVNPNYTEINAEADQKSPDSIIGFYRRLTALRREYPQLSRGDFQMVCRKNRRVIAYLREADGRKLLVAVNLTGRAAAADFSELGIRHGVQLLGTHRVNGFDDRISLLPYEGRVYLIKD